MKDRNIHRPRHIYLDNKIYFVTSRTYNELNYFNTNKKKDIFIEVFKNSIDKFKISMFAWVLLANHYHLLFKIKNNSLAAVNPDKDLVWSDTRKGVTEKTEKLSNFINYLHSITSLKLNRLDNISGRKIWYQYWDHCIRDDKDFFKRFNYIHNNPIKHKIVINIEEISKYKYSSFNTWIKKKGKEWIYSSFEEYPILDFTVEND